MGNRAVITTAPYCESNVGIYLHWNGGRDSVEGFLSAAREMQYRDPVEDELYSLARLTQIIGNFFGGSLSLGIGRCDQLDTDGDNGVYLVGKDWQIVGRMNYHGREQGSQDSTEIARATVAKTRAAEELANA